jgi:hypothetical protein
MSALDRRFQVRIGDEVTYRRFGGSVRNVRVVDIGVNIEDGRPGFVGRDLTTDEEVDVLDSRIIAIVGEEQP